MWIPQIKRCGGEGGGAAEDHDIKRGVSALFTYRRCCIDERRGNMRVFIPSSIPSDERILQGSLFSKASHEISENIGVG